MRISRPPFIMEFVTWQALIAFALLVISVYYYFSARLNYWRNKGVPGPSSYESLKSLFELFWMKQSIHERMLLSYKKWKKYPFIGITPEIKPALVVSDLDLIKSVLIKDFHVFQGRGLTVNEELDPLEAHLFNLDGDRWKILRNQLTPVFTSGKLKHMFDLMLECSDHYEQYVKDQVDAGEDLEFREISAKFTTDVIGSCAFGIEMNALSKEDSEFRKVGRKVFKSSRWAFSKRLLAMLVPRLIDIFKIHLVDKDISDFFISSIKQTIAYRKRENVVRHDFIDTLIEIKEKNNKDFKVTDELLAAQAFVFFLAGFETSSTTISFALYELAYNPDVQEKLIDEIVTILEQNNGKLSYAAVNQMKYLEMVIDETLRKNPPVGSLRRKAFERYNIPNTNVTIEAGTVVNIPVYAIQHDPEYFPDPEQFDPERFSEDARRKRHPMAHLPFGDGPKNCIGLRFAAYQVKLGLIKILKNYRIKPTPLSPYPYIIDPTAFITTPKGGVHLKLEPISS